MTVKEQKWSAFMADHRQRLHESAVASMRKRLQDYDTDAKSEGRLKLPECRYCHYIGSGGIHGAAISRASCGICGVTMQFPTTKTDLLCKACADAQGLCRHCGGKAGNATGDVSHSRSYEKPDGIMKGEFLHFHEKADICLDPFVPPRPGTLGEPYGFVRVNGKLESDPREQMALMLIAKMRYAEYGGTLEQIASSLNANLIKPRAGEEWTAGMIAGILGEPEE